MNKVKIKLIDSSLRKPQFKTFGSCGLDLYSREDVVILPKQMKMINLNVVVKSPSDCFVGLLPRSSLFKKKGLILVNSMGVIDRDYCGNEDEIKAQLFNMSDDPINITKGEDILQLLFIKNEVPELEFVDEMYKVNRGGFGSTD